MQTKARFIFIFLITFVFFVSYKIIEPDILNNFYAEELSEEDILRGQVIQELILNFSVDYYYKLNATPWDIARNWIQPHETYPEETPEMGAILKALNTAEIIEATTGRGGTQNKLLLRLEGGQKAAFKPKRFTRDHVIHGSPYAGEDRHNGEIAAFHLSRLLHWRRTAIVVGRKINLKSEVIPVATKKLLDTFYTAGNDTCFHGVCYYCDDMHGLCADGEVMEGAMLLWLTDAKLDLKRHPWARTYNKKRAQWEVDATYCDTVRRDKVHQQSLLLDMIDTAVFDYLIGNADRHNYEKFKDVSDSVMLMIDNGKSFGNPDVNEISILAPLYQCCLIRESSWRRLLVFQDGVLSAVLKGVLSQDPIAPLLDDSYYKSIDRQLRAALRVIDQCFSEHGRDNVIVGDS